MAETTMERMVKVRCGNPYFKGEVEGVQFEQAKGGAVGHATVTQARAIVQNKNFFSEELADLLGEDADDGDVSSEPPTLGEDADDGDVSSEPPTLGEDADDGDVSSEPPTLGDLSDLDGVGEVTIEKLNAAGVDDLATLVMAEADELAEATGISADKIEDWQTQAKDALDATG